MAVFPELFVRIFFLQCYVLGFLAPFTTPSVVSQESNGPLLETRIGRPVLINSDVTNLKTLRLVQVIYRHGNRSPIVQFPKDPNFNESLWPDGFSALTKEGKMLQYQLGQYLRRRYDGFLNGAYSPSEIYVQSSDADRAIMSAICNLAGLYPARNEDSKTLGIPWQPIPVHTIPEVLDNFLQFKASCPRFGELKYEYIRHSPFARSVNEAHKDLYAYLSENSGLNVTDFEVVSDLYDTLKIQADNNLTLPNWTKNIFPQKMAYLSTLPFDMRVQVPTKEAQLVKCGPFLKKLMNNMKNRSKLSKGGKLYEAGSSKMYMFAGHDSTISILLGTLGVFDVQFPSFGSTALLELHELPLASSNSPALENREGPNNETDFYVKVFFRNETTVPPYELIIPNCEDPCKLKIFEKLFASVTKDGADWQEGCKETSAAIKM